MPASSPYDDLIMEHIKNARNYCVPTVVTQTATGINALCGDELTLYIAIANDSIAQVAFQCTCCGISMASASMMTALIGGSTIDSARAQLQPFADLLLGHSVAPPSSATPEQRAILETVQKFPARARCAALPWATLAGALAQRSETILQP